MALQQDRVAGRNAPRRRKGLPTGAELVAAVNASRRKSGSTAPQHANEGYTSRQVFIAPVTGTAEPLLQGCCDIHLTATEREPAFDPMVYKDRIGDTTEASVAASAHVDASVHVSAAAYHHNGDVCDEQLKQPRSA